MGSGSSSQKIKDGSNPSLSNETKKNSKKYKVEVNNKKDESNEKLTKFEVPTYSFIVTRNPISTYTQENINNQLNEVDSWRNIENSKIETLGNNKNTIESNYQIQNRFEDTRNYNSDHLNHSKDSHFQEIHFQNFNTILEEPDNFSDNDLSVPTIELQNNSFSFYEFQSQKIQDSLQVPNYFYKTTVAELLLIIVSAKGIKAADYNGKSDPYALVSLLNSKFFPTRKTKTIMRSLEPQWDEALWFHVQLDGDYKSPPNRNLRIELYDYDRMTSDDFLASIDIDLKDYILEDREATYEVILPFQKGKGTIRVLLLWKTNLHPNSLISLDNEPFNANTLKDIHQAWISCIKRRKKSSQWALHEYTDIIWIVCFKNFSGFNNPFSGSLIYCKLEYSENFPDELPNVKFLTPFIHPNIDHNGVFVYKDFVKKFSTKKFYIFLDWIVEILEKPSIEFAVNKQLASLYHQKPTVEGDRNRYYQRIRGDIEKSAM